MPLIWKNKHSSLEFAANLIALKLVRQSTVSFQRETKQYEQVNHDSSFFSKNTKQIDCTLCSKLFLQNPRQSMLKCFVCKSSREFIRRDELLWIGTMNHLFQHQHKQSLPNFVEVPEIFLAKRNFYSTYQLFCWFQEHYELFSVAKNANHVKWHRFSKRHMLPKNDINKAKFYSSSFIAFCASFTRVNVDSWSMSAPRCATA